MFTAQKLRKRSTAEYLLYMWQMEDLIRAYGCSLKRIRDEYISRFDYSDEQREQETDWFGDLIRMMNSEGKRERGHLDINRVVLQDMVDLHDRLLQSDRFPFYTAQYYKVLPFIVELRNKGNRGVGEIETCLNALYGLMMLRLQHKPVSEETEAAMKEITTFIGMLSDYHIKDNTEGIDWGDNDL